MEYTLSKLSGHYQANLSGSFTFNDNSKFREIIEMVGIDKPQSLTLNFAALEFIDSAALGMLLLLNDEAGKSSTKVCLAQANGQIKKMLQLSNFEQIFSMETQAAEEESATETEEVIEEDGQESGT